MHCRYVFFDNNLGGDGIKLFKKYYFHYDFSLKKVNFHNQFAKNSYDGLLQIYQGDSKLWNITTDVASTSVGSRSPEMHVCSRSASYFCPAHFYGAAVFFVDEKKRDKWSAHVWNVNESDRVWAVSTIYRKVRSKRGANEARSLADQ
jgi:hypothetical protein